MDSNMTNKQQVSTNDLIIIRRVRSSSRAASDPLFFSFFLLPLPCLTASPVSGILGFPPYPLAGPVRLSA